jgi:hypothetical protein
VHPERHVLITEIREVPGFQGYGASADGRIWSRRRPSGKRGIVVAEWREKAQTLGRRRGYLMVITSINGRIRNLYAHLMVWRAFKGEPPEGHEIDHIDGVKGHNWLGNLEPVTRSENARRAIRMGLSVVMRGENHPMRKITAADVVIIRSQAAGGVTQREIGALYGLCQSHVSAIVRRERWNHVQETGICA